MTEMSEPVVVEVAEMERHVPAQRDRHDVHQEHQRHWIEQTARLSQERQRYTDKQTP